MTSQSDPQPQSPADADDYPRTGQHGPEMDDTQVAATEGLRDQLPEVDADPEDRDDAD